MAPVEGLLPLVLGLALLVSAFAPLVLRPPRGGRRRLSLRRPPR